MDTSEAHDAQGTSTQRPVTHTQTQTQTQGTVAPGTPPTPSTSTAPAVGALRLRGMGNNSTRVQWDEEVVDNEFMGRKKSKICCIYHRPKASFDESSGSESDSSCGSTDSRAGRPLPHHEHHHHASESGPQGRENTQGIPIETEHGGENASRPASNAYEKPSGGGKGKARQGNDP